MRSALRPSQRPNPRRQQAAKPPASTDPIHGETLPVHSFRTLLADLATLTRNRVQFGADRQETLLAAPTKLQRTALDMLGITQLA